MNAHSPKPAISLRHSLHKYRDGWSIYDNVNERFVARKIATYEEAQDACDLWEEDPLPLDEPDQDAVDAASARFARLQRSMTTYGREA